MNNKKIENFLYYYKFHLLAGIILLLLAIFTIRGCVNRVTPDYSMAFVGAINYGDGILLKDKLKTSIPEIKEPVLDGAMFTSDIALSADAQAIQMKILILFSAQDVDLFIVDKNIFIQYVEEGAFLNLDPYAESLKVDKEKNTDYILKIRDNTEKHLYGIDISDSDFLKESGISGSEMIAVVSPRSKRLDITTKVVRLMLNNESN